MRTVDQYIESLRDERAVYYRGTRVPDVTRHPVIGVAVRHAAITEPGSAARAPPSPVSLAAARSIIPSRRYPSAGAAPLTRNGTTATRFGSSATVGCGHQWDTAKIRATASPSPATTSAADRR